MEMRLGICLPLTNDMVHSQFLDSWTLLEKPDFTYHRPQFPMNLTSDISHVRNNIVRQTLECDRTHLMLLDTDQTYPPDAINKMIKHAENGCQIVAGKVHRRYKPFDPILYRGEPDSYEMVSEKEWKSGELVEVDATGAACMLIDINVFLDMEFPWYEMGETSLGKTIGEDIYFCFKARQLGIKIYVDTSIEIGHLALMEINEGFYDVNKIVNKVIESKKK